jgi:hypothetical protein
MPAKKTTDPAPEPVLPAPVPESPAPDCPTWPMAPGDERTWGVLAHLSVLLNLLTGFAGPIVSLVIYLVYKDRSRFVAYQALQSTIFQLLWWFGGGVLIGLIWAVVGLLSMLLVGILLIPFALLATLLLALLPLGALVYGIVGGIQVSQGQDFKYWLIGDWVRGTFTG